MSAVKMDILLAAEDAGTDFAYYDRKEDESLTREQLLAAVESGLVSWSDIGRAFVKGAEGA